MKFVFPLPCFQYPLSKLVSQLAFEDENEAAAFCSHHGLTVHGGSTVTMDRSHFVSPEAAFPDRRAHRLIESKQMGTVGEVSVNTQR